jgi:formiminotetrahydrofolate cyclodeaminase
MNDKMDNARSDRRDFLKKAGKFAIYTPPAMMMLMHPSAHAVRGSLKGNNGFGNGGQDGSPNGMEDINR